MAVKPDFYLWSTEGYDMASPRMCWRLAEFHCEKGKQFLQVKVDPTINGQKYMGVTEDIGEVFIASRYKGVDIFTIKKWPVSVYLTCLKAGFEPHNSILASN
ncbi:MAG: hypothetical protein H7X92_03830, partial [Chitinophagales bacterium]|nr:hypothetical protein [Hyphomicrobiales bacterium]